MTNDSHPDGAAPLRDERGYSLIEVLAAAALLLGVLLAIMGMFIYGGRSVNSGKLMTRATGIATDVLEEFRDLSFTQTYLVIEDAGAIATDTSYTWNSNTNGPQRPTTGSEYDLMLQAWKAAVESKTTGLPNGRITITVRGLQNLGPGNADPPELNFASARLLQVVVSVRWKQAHRSRSVVFETFKS